jgi:hypothetical protein
MDKSVFSIVSLFDTSDEKAYWLSKEPSERLKSMEDMRQALYAYTSPPPRLQRILEVTQFPGR